MEGIWYNGGETLLSGTTWFPEASKYSELWVRGISKTPQGKEGKATDMTPNKTTEVTDINYEQFSFDELQLEATQLTTQDKLESAERDYLFAKTTYAELSARYKVPLYVLARYAKERRWVQRRREYSEAGCPDAFDISRLVSSSTALEAVIDEALRQASARAEESGDIDTKTLKELASALKEAINIKQTLLLLPVVTEQKQLELRQKRAPSSPDAHQEIVVTLENGADRFCV